jgi:chaperonin cofactor prefoldin
MIESLLAITVAIITVLTASALGVRWLTKHYFDEIKAELKPNGGSSIKDQVNRLEKQHEKLESKVDKIYEAILENGLKSNSRKAK